MNLVPAAKSAGISLYQMENGMPEFKDVSQVLEALSGSASAEKLKGMDATILFDLSGEESGQWTVTIDDGKVDFEEGSPESPSVTVEAKAEDLKALVKGELNPMAAFMQGRLKVKGDMSVAMQLQKLFS
jgi:putative sterol carrier protein